LPYAHLGASQKNPLTAITEAPAEETLDDVARPGFIGAISKKGKSFRMLECTDEEDGIFDDAPVSNPVQNPDSTLSVQDPGNNGSMDEEMKRKKREVMMQTMKKATSALSFGGKRAGKGVAQKAKSARNVFEQATTKVFARHKEEGKGLLKCDDD
jgi:hypothetical protein